MEHGNYEQFYDGGEVREFYVYIISQQTSVLLRGALSREILLYVG